jgi:lipid-A-disaccharide synthase
MSLSLLFSTGEVSGDVIGAMLARELKAMDPETSMWGVGGERMKAVGVRILVDGNPLGSVGITEPLSTLPGVFKSFTSICSHARRKRPDAAVLIGHEGFNLVLSHWLKRNGILTIAYFPPQIWIWRNAAAPIARCYDWILTSFEQEELVYRRVGGQTIFVGHYLRDLLAEVSPEAKSASRKVLGLAQERKLIGILPGSRLQEVERLGPVMLDAVCRLVEKDPLQQFVLPIADTCLEEDILQMIRDRGLERRVVLCHDSRMAMAASDLVMLCSGTATLEAALMGVPMVILYRLSHPTMAVVRLLVRTGIMDSETAGLPNLLSGKTLVKELRQADAHPAGVVEAVWRLLADADRQEEMKEGLRQLTTHLGPTGVARRAAQAILDKATEAAPSRQGQDR